MYQYGTYSSRMELHRLGRVGSVLWGMKPLRHFRIKPCTDWMRRSTKFGFLTLESNTTCTLTSFERLWPNFFLFLSLMTQYLFYSKMQTWKVTWNTYFWMSYIFILVNSCPQETSMCLQPSDNASISVNKCFSDFSSKADTKKCFL